MATASSYKLEVSETANTVYIYMVVTRIVRIRLVIFAIGTCLLSGS